MIVTSPKVYINTSVSMLQLVIAFQLAVLLEYIEVAKQMSGPERKTGLIVVAMKDLHVLKIHILLYIRL